MAGSQPQERYRVANRKNLKVGQSKSYQKYSPPASDQIYDYLKDMKLAEEDLHESNILEINGNKITIEIADTPKKRKNGLMYRRSLPPDHGMIFIFENTAPRSFWMKNTHIPLSIAFIDLTGRILEIKDMHPRSLNPCQSAAECKYVLEMNQGWFDRREIIPGDQIIGLDQIYQVLELKLLRKYVKVLLSETLKEG